MSFTTALCSALALPERGVPDWVHLLPVGTVRTKDGRGPYSVHDVRALMSASMALGKLPIDENHATDLAAPKGGPSPARGWIVELQQRADGIWGRVEWTATGLRVMREREYSGLSPVIAHGADGVVSAILRASLVNVPNIVGLTTLHSEAPATFRDRLQALMERRVPLPPPAAVTLSTTDHDIIRRLGLDPVAYAAQLDAAEVTYRESQGVALQKAAALDNGGFNSIERRIMGLLERIPFSLDHSRRI